MGKRKNPRIYPRRHGKRRRNPSTLVNLGIGAAVIGGGILAVNAITHATSATTPTDTPTKSTFKAASDTLNRMNLAYNGYKQQRGIAPDDQATWVVVMQQNVYNLPTSVWATVYNLSLGYARANAGTEPPEAQIEAWLNYYANQPLSGTGG